MTEDSPVRPRGALALSGLYDLAPLRQSFLQPEIGLSEGEVALWSPVHARYRANSVLHLMVGAEETAPFHDQAEQFRSILQDNQCPVDLLSVAAANHMSIVLDLGDASTIAGAKLASLVSDD